MALLRHGGMGRLFARAYAPSTFGCFLRAFYGRGAVHAALAGGAAVSVTGRWICRADPARDSDGRRSVDAVVMDE